MSYSDDVRKYCIDNIITPARSKGAATATIRAGDIHSALGYRNRMPLVCGALGARVFETTANVVRESITGPSNGANAVFVFKIKNQ
jgi:hypothetical protein